MNDSAKIKAAQKPIRKLDAPDLNLVTLETLARGNTVAFLEDVYISCARATEALTKKIEALRAAELPCPQPCEVAIVVAEVNAGLWTGVANVNRTILRQGNKSWDIQGHVATYVDGHDNTIVYAPGMVRFTDDVLGCRRAWVKVESHTRVRHIRTDMPLNPQSTVDKLIEMIEGKANIGSELYATHARWLDTCQIREFLPALRKWRKQVGDTHIRFTDELAAGECWFAIIDQLKGVRKADSGHHFTPTYTPIQFSAHFLVKLLTLSAHVDDRLQRYLFTHLRTRQNSLVNPHAVGTEPTIYTYGGDIFEQVALAHTKRKERIRAMTFEK